MCARSRALLLRRPFLPSAVTVSLPLASYASLILQSPQSELTWPLTQFESGHRQSIVSRNARAPKWHCGWRRAIERRQIFQIRIPKARVTRMPAFTPSTSPNTSSCCVALPPAAHDPSGGASRPHRQSPAHVGEPAIPGSRPWHRRDVGQADYLAGERHFDQIIFRSRHVWRGASARQACSALLKRCASCVENSRSLTSCRLVASPLVAIIGASFR